MSDTDELRPWEAEWISAADAIAWIAFGCTKTAQQVAAEKHAFQSHYGVDASRTINLLTTKFVVTCPLEECRWAAGPECNVRAKNLEMISLAGVAAGPSYQTCRRQWRKRCRKIAADAVLAAFCPRPTISQTGPDRAAETLDVRIQAIRDLMSQMPDRASRLDQSRTALAAATRKLVTAIRRGLLRPYKRDKLSYESFDLVAGMTVNMGGHLVVDYNAPMERYAELRKERSAEETEDRERQRHGYPPKSREVWFKSAEVLSISPSKMADESTSDAPESPSLAVASPKQLAGNTVGTELKRRPGRPGSAETSIKIFTNRRALKLPLEDSKIREARAILAQWPDGFPCPQDETIAAHITPAWNEAKVVGSPRPTR
jgi:hypothetical protein